jgi:predicted AAA+ superfamily ATPase
MYPRLLNPTRSNSYFLFGARGTGKSTLLSHLFADDEVVLIDLLQTDTLATLQANPSELNNILAASAKPWCLIDEVQKIPPILDIVHAQIEKKRVKFVLTGSSARKLKRDSANLLGGRAFLYKLFPLTHIELGDDFNLDSLLNFGSLAKITEFQTSRDKILFLKSYVENYLKEEILVEQLIRNLPPFRRFLEIAAINDTEIINYSNIARDVKSDPKNIANYYAILEDTLLGFFLEPYHTSLRKRQAKSPKFYWFDVGVRRALSGTLDIPVIPKSFEYGSLFESFLVNEIFRLLTYAEKSFKLSFIRVDENLEIDLVLERAGTPTYLIEIKSTTYVNDNHTGVLERYSKEISNSVPLLLSQDKTKKKIGAVTCMHWLDGIEELGLNLPISSS